MKSFVLMVLALTLQMPLAHALLPPFYQTAEQYRALLDDPRLVQAIGSGQALESISLRENGFLIKTPKYSLEVDVVFEPQKRPGPAKYHFQFQTPVER